VLGESLTVASLESTCASRGPTGNYRPVVADDIRSPFTLTAVRSSFPFDARRPTGPSSSRLSGDPDTSSPVDRRSCVALSCPHRPSSKLIVFLSFRSSPRSGVSLTSTRRSTFLSRPTSNVSPTVLTFSTSSPRVPFSPTSRTRSVLCKRLFEVLTHRHLGHVL